MPVISGGWPDDRLAPDPLGQLSLSGAALLIIEATAVLREGRIFYGDVGLWDDATEAAIGAVLTGARRCSAMPIAVQSGAVGTYGNVGRCPLSGPFGFQ